MNMSAAAPRSRILLVDDAPENLRILSESLRADYTIMFAKNGPDALRLAIGTPQPDLILLDVIMPGMDGYEVCRRLKEDPSTRDIPVMFITAQNEETDEATGLSLGAQDYIVKPFTFERFRESMLQFQEKRRLLMSPEVAITQDILDRRIFIKKSERGAGRPKGIDAQTLETVVSVLKEQPGLFSLKDIERLAGISRISLKKYFDYLAETGRLGSSKGYGGQGRPVTLYNWLG